jgi:hypothetical protein
VRFPAGTATTRGSGAQRHYGPGLGDPGTPVPADGEYELAPGHGDEYCAAFPEGDAGEEGEELLNAASLVSRCLQDKDYNELYGR